MAAARRSKTMKKIGIILFWSALSLISCLLILLLLWSVIPIHGITLPHLLELVWNIAFHSAALIVSLTCGVLAVGVMSFTLLTPSPCSTEKMDVS
jgi:hypothetical protein